jgi:uncharacterized protein YqeY
MLELVQEDLARALKAGDKQTVSALRMLVSAIKNAQIDNRAELTNEQSIKIVQKEIKKRIEARDMYQQHNRTEQAAGEEFERQLLSKYVPSMLTEQEIDTLITAEAAKLTDVGFSNLMPAVMKVAAGRADGKMVAERVKAYLA